MITQYVAFDSKWSPWTKRNFVRSNSSITTRTGLCGGHFIVSEWVHDCFPSLKSAWMLCYGWLLGDKTPCHLFLRQGCVYYFLEGYGPFFQGQVSNLLPLVADHSPTCITYETSRWDDNTNWRQNNYSASIFPSFLRSNKWSGISDYDAKLNVGRWWIVWSTLKKIRCLLQYFNTLPFESKLMHQHLHKILLIKRGLQIW